MRVKIIDFVALRSFVRRSFSIIQPINEITAETEEPYNRDAPGTRCVSNFQIRR